MSLPSTERQELVGLLPGLAEGADNTEVLSFVRQRLDACLSELVTTPGYEVARAGVLRALPSLNVDLDLHRRSARVVIDAYPEQVSGGDPSVLLARHPSWVGISCFHLGLPKPEALALALKVASPGFAAVDNIKPASGNVLWAMAEEAGGVGWQTLEAELLDAALEHPFDEEATRATVLLVAGLHDAELGRASALDRLVKVATHSENEPRERVHAGWVLATLNPGSARSWLELALKEADEEARPKIAERLAGLS